jgi:hypothetical protein
LLLLCVVVATVKPSRGEVKIKPVGIPSVKFDAGGLGGEVEFFAIKTSGKCTIRIGSLFRVREIAECLVRVVQGNGIGGNPGKRASILVVFRTEVQVKCKPPTNPILPFPPPDFTFAPAP